MHLDTAHTHIVSSIIHVANDLAPGEKWPLYIYAHDGTLHKARRWFCTQSIFLDWNALLFTARWPGFSFPRICFAVP